MFNLDKNIQFCKLMVPSKYDVLILVLAILIGAFAKDLQLDTVYSVCGAALLYELCYGIVWLIHACIVCIFKYKRDKKHQKQKESEENNENI